MFSYIPLIGLGPVQVSLFVQTVAPFCCSSHPQDSCSSEPYCPLRSQPFCLREVGGFCPKAREKKIKPSNLPRKMPMAELHFWARSTAAPGTSPSAVSKAASARAPLPGTDVLGPLAVLNSPAQQSGAPLRREVSGPGAERATAGARHLAASNSLCPVMKLCDSDPSSGIAPRGLESQGRCPRS